MCRGWARPTGGGRRMSRSPAWRRATPRHEDGGWLLVLSPCWQAERTRELDLGREALVELARGETPAELCGELGPERHRVAQVEGGEDRVIPRARRPLQVERRSRRQPSDHERPQDDREHRRRYGREQPVAQGTNATALATSPATGVRSITSTPATMIASPRPRPIPSRMAASECGKAASSPPGDRARTACRSRTCPGLDTKATT